MSIRIFGSAVPVFYIFCSVQHLSWHYCAQRALAIVAIVFPSHPAAPSARRFSSVILGSDFLSVVLDALVVLSVGKRGGRKKDENQNRTQEKRNYISFNSKTFSPAGSRATTATRVTTITTTWEATSQEKDVFGSALWFGSATVVVVVCCCCCCCCRSVCCLLVRISKSFIIILWH